MQVISMVPAGRKKAGLLLGGLFCACAFVPAQQPTLPSGLTETGQIVVAGRAMPYLIRRLPVSSFPELPGAFADQLNRRGCMIPQTYEAHHPENVIHARLERPDSTDWAVLCSAQGTVSLLVYFASSPDRLQVLAIAPETERLQVHGSSGVLGFNWGIDPASPAQIRQSQMGMDHRPPPVNHDALADTLLDHHTVYHFYEKSAWIVLEMPE
jgi:hypothetical protein